MKTIKDYIEKNRERFLEELFELIRMPSISSQAEHKADMYRCAGLWKKLLLEAGADRAEVFETDGNPVTYGEKIIDASLPTVLVYGHMDVMPVDPLEEWLTDPFEPVIRDGKIWARGADDDKGQAFMHVKALEYMTRNGRLPCNVKFMIEGEEEIGSPSLPRFCRERREMLAADVILVSDTSMIARDVPSITTGLRGLSYWQVEVTGPSADLHSGLFGGAVTNPINALCGMIAGLLDERGRVTIPGFYDDAREVSREERAKMAAAPFDEEAYKRSLGVRELKGEEGFTTGERVGIRPTLDVCGIWGGYTGEGAKTVLPSKARAKISCRLVPDQQHEKIGRLVQAHLEAIAPAGVSVKVEYLHGGPSYACPIDLPAYRAAEEAYREVYGKMPVPVRSGGSIPIIATFEEVLGVKSVLMGFGLGSDAIHSPNENYPLEQFFNGITTIPLFYKHFASIAK
ncbi:MAG: dipeptidase [Odoribacteraceae bacterium]|jgi:acetylornithine deacetylase/succinyl-diaminopimelate desuccinylase-like protein|nr:dipeptidase [Odoribacteraceae bacterium]